MAPYKIAEIFDSIQGEGYWAGYRMVFLRFAGCNVGRYISPENLPSDLGPLRVLHPTHSICTSVFGKQFLCDTNYFAMATYTTDELLQAVLATGTNINRVCLTGGEPFIYDLRPLLTELLTRDIAVHIETSGTREILEPEGLKGQAWITVSPKAGILHSARRRANEFKFLVSPEDGTPDSIVSLISEMAGFNFLPEDARPPIYLQGINGVSELDLSSRDFLIEVLKAAPRGLNLALSVQMHKVLGLR